MADHGSALTLEARVGRLEAEAELRQLVARYALAVDSRDLNTLVSLFCTDVACGRWGNGRAALAAFYDGMLRRFKRTIHTVASQVIDLDGDGVARGVVYCRAEHEVGDDWVVQSLCYFDDYEREAGRWRFRRRSVESFYVNDILARPGDPTFLQHPGLARHTRLPERFPTWRAFWDE